MESFYAFCMVSFVSFSSIIVSQIRAIGKVFSNMSSFLSPYKYHYARNFKDGTRGGQSWEPGFWRNFPWLGFLAIAGAIGCGIAAAIVIAVSDGIPNDSWVVGGYALQPAVLLSIFATVANAMLAYAFAQGLTIAWWSKALRGCTLGELHRYWNYGSMTAVVTSGPYFSTVALASLLLTSSLISGPLLQRASSATARDAYSTFNVTLPISPSPWPREATAYYGPEEPGYMPSFYTPTFQKVMQDYSARTAITVASGCIGTCTG